MTERQKLFAERYLANGFNAKEAYEVAFGAVDNKKPTLANKKSVVAGKKSSNKVAKNKKYGKIK